VWILISLRWLKQVTQRPPSKFFKLHDRTKLFCRTWISLYLIFLITVRFRYICPSSRTLLMNNIYVRLRDEKRGNVAIEAAIIFPVVVLILTVLIDLIRYHSAQQQLHNAATAIAQSISLKPTITNTELAHYTSLLSSDDALSNYTLHYRFASQQFKAIGSGVSDINLDEFSVENNCQQVNFQFVFPEGADLGFTPSQNLAVVSICATPKAGAFLNPMIASLNPPLKQTAMANSSTLKWL
jgi:Flp pilus assembly protein TadG